MSDIQIIHGDCLEVMPTLAANSVHSIVSDPPYGLKFMGKSWDHGVPGEPFWREAFRVAKPGAYLLAFGGTRTFHRLACAIEDAGWEIRDTIGWLYGSGFPKSLSIGKAVDKLQGNEREVVGKNTSIQFIENGVKQKKDYGESDGMLGKYGHNIDVTKGTSAWEGWGTNLKPAWEPVIMARKPIDGTVANNVLTHGCGGINIDGCRVAAEPELAKNWNRKQSQSAKEGRNSMSGGLDTIDLNEYTPSGRFPANIIHDGSEEVLEVFPESNGQQGDVRGTEPSYTGQNGIYGNFRRTTANPKRNDSGSAARFFKCCKKDSLSCLTCAKVSDIVVSNHKERIELWKRIAAHNAEKNGKTSKATSEFIARIVAIGTQNENLVLNVKSAGSLCDLCATSIAVALVGIKTSAFSSEELQAILACTSNCNVSTLIQNLVSFADLWANTDTIPTTNSLSLLFGSVRDAIENYTKQGRTVAEVADSGPEKETACRFKYSPKASKADRNEGCEGLPLGEPPASARSKPAEGRNAPLGEPRTNHHPTVKPTDLMRYLCRLVTPPGGTVLDPFMGSGSTGKAAVLEGFGFVGIDLDAEFCEIARRRVAFAEGVTLKEKDKMGLFPDTDCSVRIK